MFLCSEREGVTLVHCPFDWPDMTQKEHVAVFFLCGLTERFLLLVIVTELRYELFRPASWGYLCSTKGITNDIAFD